LRFSLLSKPKIERENFIKNKEINPELVAELSLALDNLDIEKIKSILRGLTKTNQRISSAFEMLGLSKSGFYNMLSPKGNPEFVTILRLLNLFNIKLSAEKR
jgi:DNA-binding phage protein